MHLILKCGEVLLAHYAPLPCIIWCFFVLYGSTKDTAIERAYCRNSARQVIVVRLYLKYLGVFRYFLVSPDYLLHIYSWNSSLGIEKIRNSGISILKSKVEKIPKDSLDLIPSPSSSVKIQIMGGKVCLMCKGKTLLGIVNKLLKTKSLLTPSNVLPYYLN